MIKKPEKKEIRNRIHKRIRRKLSGTAARPRLAVFRSVAHIYAQVIDDVAGATVVSASSVDKLAEGATGGKKKGGNVAAATLPPLVLAALSTLEAETTVVPASSSMTCA